MNIYTRQYYTNLIMLIIILRLTFMKKVIKFNNLTGRFIDYFTVVSFLEKYIRGRGIWSEGWQ